MTAKELFLRHDFMVITGWFLSAFGGYVLGWVVCRRKHYDLNKLANTMLESARIIRQWEKRTRQYQKKQASQLKTVK